MIFVPSFPSVCHRVIITIYRLLLLDEELEEELQAIAREKELKESMAKQKAKMNAIQKGRDAKGLDENVEGKRAELAAERAAREAARALHAGASLRGRSRAPRGSLHGRA